MPIVEQRLAEFAESYATSGFRKNNNNRTMAHPMRFLEMEMLTTRKTTKRLLFVRDQNRLQDLACLCLILLLAALVFLVRNGAVPMQIWDESRNANNALEMNRTGFSLVTRFHGVADHWSTKPPLLIWLIAYSLAFWRYLESPDRPPARWIVIAGVALALSTLTKGVGGVLALPALLLYAIVRRRLSNLVRDWRVWLILLGVMLVIGGYYVLREHADPGYLAAVWRNEFTGRYLAVNEDHRGGAFYYIHILTTKFEPGFILLPLVSLPFFRPERLRRSVVLLCLLVAGVLLAVLTKSQTKVFWYLAPATPFLALAVGIGLSDGLSWLHNRGAARGALLQTRISYLAVAAIFVTANLGAIYYYQVGVEQKVSSAYMGGRYGPFLEEIRRSNLTRNILLLDEGSSEAMIDNQIGDFAHYSPEAEFFAKVEEAQGLRVKVAVPGSTLAAGTWIATCDPRSHAWLTAHYQVAVALQSRPWCALEQTGDARTASLTQ